MGWNLGRIRLGRRRCEFGHALQLHVAAVGLPLVVLLQQHRPDQSRDRGLAGEDADHVGPALHLLVEAFGGPRASGLGVEDSQPRRPERLDRPILVVTLALFWAVSTGMWDAVHRATPDEREPRHSSPATCCAA